MSLEKRRVECGRSRWLKLKQNCQESRGGLTPTILVELGKKHRELPCTLVARHLDTVTQPEEHEEHEGLYDCVTRAECPFEL